MTDKLLVKNWLFLILLFNSFSLWATPLLVSPASQEALTLSLGENQAVLGESSNAEPNLGADCPLPNGPLDERHEKLVNSIARILEGVEQQVNPKANRHGEVINRQEVMDLSLARLCLELHIYKQQNHLDFPLECEVKCPENSQARCEVKMGKLPEMRMELIKNDDFSDLEEIVQMRVKGRTEWLAKQVASQWTSPEDRDKYQREINCWKGKDHSQCGNENHNLQIYRSQLPQSGKLTLEIVHQGVIYPFKTYHHNSDRLIIQSKPGPKLKEGDMMTPEGSFKLDAVKLDSSYFIATHIDYESWAKSGERDKLLSEVPGANNQKRGGAVMIHGAGGSVGCLSLNNSDAAFVTAVVKAQHGLGRTPWIDIYPIPMKEELIKNLTQDELYRPNQSFWKSLKQVHDRKEAKKDLRVRTINELLGP